MRVTFASFGEQLATSRLRAIIPQRELEKLGVMRGMDVLVYGKHFITIDQTRPYSRRVFDISDNHFDAPLLGAYYREHALAADLVTCSSEVLKGIIKEETGRDAVVIPEPYESRQRTPSIGDLLYWFGHESNLNDLRRVAPSLEKWPIVTLTGEAWSIERHNEVMENPLIVIIPTGKSMAKSENRMVEAIRQGKYVCAEYLPAYEQFVQYMPTGNIASGVEWALSNQEEAIERIKLAQEYIRNRFSPETIGKRWLEVLNEHIKLH